MSKKIKTIIEDGRKVISVETTSKIYNIGHNQFSPEDVINIDRFQVYQESGERAYATWIAVIDHFGNMPMRINCSHCVAISYESSDAESYETP